MRRDLIDQEGMSSPKAQALRDMTPPRGFPFRVSRIGHVVLMVADLERSVAFYTGVLGFRVSDVYPDSMMPGGMVFLRCNADHHGVAALVGSASEPSQSAELHHMAFEVATLDEVVRARDHLLDHEVPIDFEGRRRAGCQVAIEFRDPDDHRLEIYWGLDQVGSDERVRPGRGVARRTVARVGDRGPTAEAGYDAPRPDPQTLTPRRRRPCGQRKGRPGNGANAEGTVCAATKFRSKGIATGGIASLDTNHHGRVEIVHCRADYSKRVVGAGWLLARGSRTGCPPGGRIRQ